MEIRNANIIFNKNGNGFQSNKITLPVPFVQQLNFTENDKQAIIILNNYEIIIRKKEKNMLLIKRMNFERVNHMVDYELENGVLLYEEDWNGEIYSNGFNIITEKETNCNYKPVYKEIDEDEFEIIGFEEQ